MASDPSCMLVSIRMFTLLVVLGLVSALVGLGLVASSMDSLSMGIMFLWLASYSVSLVVSSRLRSIASAINCKSSTWDCNRFRA